jgi:hypothetical protein
VRVSIADLCLQAHGRESLDQLLELGNGDRFVSLCKPICDHVVDVHVCLERLVLWRGHDGGRFDGVGQ